MDSHAPPDAAHDELLVIRCQLGEAAAFHELVRLWSDRLLRYLQRIAPDFAEDAAQEVWIRALRGIPRLRDGTRLRPWLFGIAHNVTMDRLRRRYTETAMLTAFADEPGAGEAEDTEALLQSLETRLGELPLMEREALTLFYLEGLTLAELAQVQRVPLGTAKSRLFRARRMLRERMSTGETNAN